MHESYSYLSQSRANEDVRLIDSPDIRSIKLSVAPKDKTTKQAPFMSFSCSIAGHNINFPMTPEGNIQAQSVALEKVLADTTL